jgi:hypothetical protein
MFRDKSKGRERFMKQMQIMIGFLAIILCSKITCAGSDNPIGITISVEGQTAAINQAKQQRTLQRGGAIFLNDHVVTQKNSKAQLRLNDDSVIVVQPESEYYVSEFSFNKAAPRSNKYVGNVVKGALINISGQGETKNYQLNSPLTTIAFRGTGLATKLLSRKEGEREILLNQEVFVFSGSVRVTNSCATAVGMCEPRAIDISAGSRINAATVSRIGEVSGHQSSGIIENSGIDNKMMTSTVGDVGVSITCKGR